MGQYFNPSQISLASGAFAHAERMAGKYFRLSDDVLKSYRYDVRTLAYLKKHEVNEQAFAHLCKYQYREENSNSTGGAHFYQVCLQDNRILDAVERAGSFVKLTPLLLYIATHELVHIVRFDGGLVDFDAPLAVKIEEEEIVNNITRDMLKAAPSTELNVVMECFSNQYKIGDIFN